MARNGSTAGYVNYLGADDPQVRVEASYGTNFARLQAIKNRYDPDNVFQLNQNIPPSL